jgi:hypothetical protein
MATETDVKKALDVYSQELQKVPNVRGFGIGEKTTGGHTSGRLALLVYVSKKVPPEHLSPSALLPSAVEVRDEKGDTRSVPVDVVELGELASEKASE